MPGLPPEPLGAEPQGAETQPAAGAEATTTQTVENTPDGVGSPVVIGGTVVGALLVSLLFAVAANRFRRVPRLVQADTFMVEEGKTASGEGTEGRFQRALTRSREFFRGGLDRIFGRPVDAAALEALEEILLRADVGIQTAERLVAVLSAQLRAGQTEPAALRATLRSSLLELLNKVHAPLITAGDPLVVMVVGVNGSGKTTTIGKLAARLRRQGKKVVLAAADTYRAAAREQLEVWASRAGVDLVGLDEGADPGAVAYKALERAKGGGYDVVIVDTAGRLQTKKPLMDQLSKIRRVLDKASPGAPQETLLVLDGTMGQNALSQAHLFNEATPITGVVVTKLDGTAKGGMVFAIASELALPVKLVGLGEKLDDLRDFEPETFVDAIV